MDQQSDAPAARFLRYARLCRARDLEQLVNLAELVKALGELIHALQKERGSSAIFLGSSGGQFVGQLTVRIDECCRLEQIVREHVENLEGKVDVVVSAARLYDRVALALRALDILPGTRELVASLTVAPQDAVKTFTEIIESLLGVEFEVADIPGDPEVSRVLIALVNFAQGKEYAGQERAITGAALSNGRFHAADQSRLQHLVAAQEQAFGISLQFAHPGHISALREVLSGPESIEVKQLRKMIRAGTRSGETPSITAGAWYQHTTHRIDAMKAIEDKMACDLERLCAGRLDALRNDSASELDKCGDPTANEPVAMLVTDVDPALNPIGLGRGISLYTLTGVQPKPMRSILDVIHAQSRRIQDVSSQLESARLALAERKIIERAKGALMQTRRLSEKDAYALMRDAAMSQNKRIIQIAEAIVSMAEILKP